MLIEKNTPQIANVYFALFFIGKTLRFIFDNYKLGSNLFMISLKSDTFKCASGILDEYLYTFLTASYIAVSNPQCFSDSKTNLVLIFCLVQYTTISPGAKCN